MQTKWVLAPMTASQPLWQFCSLEGSRFWECSKVIHLHPHYRRFWKRHPPYLETALNPEDSTP